MSENSKIEIDRALDDPEIGPYVGDMLGRPRVFCASLADWLDDEVPPEWRRDLLRLIFECKNLDWLLLTKRPDNWHRLLTDFCASCGSQWAQWESEVADWLSGKMVPAHIWIGTSVEDQKRADDRIPELLKIPARVRFLSVEPMLGPIRLPFIEYCESCNRSGFQNSSADPCGNCCGSGIARAEDRIHWAIFGGESGHNARPCNIEWIRDGVRQCRAAGVAPFVKQLGADVRHDYDGMMVGKSGPLVDFKADVRIKNGPLRLNDKKGGDPSEWPEDLRVREFPEVRQ